LRIELRIGEGAQSRRQQLAADAEYSVGSSADNDICIALPTVSRQHASLRVGIEGDLAVCDLGSRNGSYVDGERLHANQWAAINADTAVRIGSVLVQLQTLSAGDEDLALALTPEQPPLAAAAAEMTLAASQVDRFTRRALPAVLRLAHSGASQLALAQALGEALSRHLPILGLEIGPLDAEELWFARPAPSAANLVAEHGQIRLALRLEPSQQSGPYLQLVELVDAVLSLAHRQTAPAAAAEQALLWPKPAPLDPVLRKLYRQAARIADSDVHVLVRGESGTGKELFAQFLHSQGANPDAPLVAVNCAAFPEDLLEAELFGVEKGVATGVEARPGMFERANGGTLFLDEIGDMAAATQARILRVLQDQQVWRLGASRARPAQVRVISATHRDLAAMRREGAFRSDLWHRIADWEVELPPLRERQADIGHLALHFLGLAAAERGIAVRGITRLALQQLCAYEWPGNVRELQREMKRAAAFMDHNAALSSAELRAEIRSAASINQGQSLSELLKRAERRIIDQAIAVSDGDMDAAAAQLGVSRATLYRRLAERDQSA